MSSFMKAKTLYERGRYLDAARGFDTVLGISRGSALAQESQWLLADSYFKARDYLMASAEYRRYAETFPRSERRPEAEYQEGLCYVRLSPRYNLDQKDTYRAIESMQLFIARYPAHERAVDAAQIIDQMRDKLARKQYAAGEMYLRIQAFEAAAIYFGLTIDQYPRNRRGRNGRLPNRPNRTSFLRNGRSPRGKPSATGWLSAHTRSMSNSSLGAKTGPRWNNWSIRRGKPSRRIQASSRV
jgi:outer membrane assembly lipoprotein YfiO